MSQTNTARPPTAGLTTLDVESYHQNGYLICRAVFSPAEMERLAEESDALMDRQDLQKTDNIRCRWKDHVLTGECTFETFDPVVDISPICKRFAEDDRILHRLQAIYGEPAHLFKDKLIFKPAGVEGYRVHQDWISWTDFPTSFLTVLLPIDAAKIDNGCTMVYPGCHLSGYVSPHDGEYHDTPATWVHGIEPIPLEMAPGDVAFFGAFTPHYSEPNRSGTTRRQLYLSYNADSDGGQRRTQHYAEFHTWLRKKYSEYGRGNVYFQ